LRRFAIVLALTSLAVLIALVFLDLTFFDVDLPALVPLSALDDFAAVVPLADLIGFVVPVFAVFGSFASPFAVTLLSLDGVAALVVVAFVVAPPFLASLAAFFFSQ
jgi:hypothetical protein